MGFISLLLLLSVVERATAWVFPAMNSAAVLAHNRGGEGRSFFPVPMVSDDDTSVSSFPTPLRFAFRGYSVWLELQDVDGDLDRALDVAASDLHVHRVPSPHVTVEYGMAQIDEREIRRRFCEDLPVQQLRKEWPDFVVRGIQTGTTVDGVDGEDMTMAWIELTLGTSAQHEAMVDLVRRVLYRDDYKPRTSKWTPHLSLCYENPEEAKSNLHYSMTIMSRVPTLTSVAKRRITGIALWKTEGTMEFWKCLERFDLRSEEEAQPAVTDEQ